jgi:hypothetical protein
MLLVLATVALVAVLGMVMLTEASMRAQTARNAMASATAETLAESGIDLACYYLLNPQRAPAFVGPHWPGAQNLTFGGVEGSVDVTVTAAGPSIYDIVAVGRTRWGSPQGLERRLAATVQVQRALEVNVAAGFTSPSVSLPPAVTINGDVQVDGALTNLGQINGNVIAASLVNLGRLVGSLLAPDPGRAMRIPRAEELHDYQTYVHNGVTCNAAVLGSSIPAGTVLGPTATNPAGVYYRSGALTIASNVRINGTLVVVGGPLNVSGTGSVITPQPGYPGAIIQGDIILRGPAWPRDLRINGLSWVGGSLKSSLLSTGGNLSFQGALLMGGGGTVDAQIGGTVVVTYDPGIIGGMGADLAPVSPGVCFMSFTE